MKNDTEQRSGLSDYITKYILWYIYLNIAIEVIYFTISNSVGWINFCQQLCSSKTVCKI